MHEVTCECEVYGKASSFPSSFKDTKCVHKGKKPYAIINIIQDSSVPVLFIYYPDFHSCVRTHDKSTYGRKDDHAILSKTGWLFGVVWGHLQHHGEWTEKGSPHDGSSKRMKREEQASNQKPDGCFCLRSLFSCHLSTTGHNKLGRYECDLWSESCYNK